MLINVVVYYRVNGHITYYVLELSELCISVAMNMLWLLDNIRERLISWSPLKATKMIKFTVSTVSEKEAADRGKWKLRNMLIRKLILGWVCLCHMPKMGKVV